MPTHKPKTKPTRKVPQLSAKPVHAEDSSSSRKGGQGCRSDKTYLVRDLPKDALFEVDGIRYRKVHSNDCRAYVKLATKRHVKMTVKRENGKLLDEEKQMEFDSETSGCINISPNTEVILIYEDVEALI